MPNTPPIPGYGDMKVEEGYRVLRGHLAITNTALKWNDSDAKNTKAKKVKSPFPGLRGFQALISNCPRFTDSFETLTKSMTRKKHTHTICIQC